MNREVDKLEARLEMDLQAETVAGKITGDDGVERRFSGWMEFASAVEAWRAERGPGAGGGVVEAPPGDQSDR